MGSTCNTRTFRNGGSASSDSEDGTSLGSLSVDSVFIVRKSSGDVCVGSDASFSEFSETDDAMALSLLWPLNLGKP